MRIPIGEHNDCFIQNLRTNSCERFASQSQIFRGLQVVLEVPGIIGYLHKYFHGEWQRFCAEAHVNI